MLKIREQNFKIPSYKNPLSSDLEYMKKFEIVALGLIQD